MVPVDEESYGTISNLNDQNINQKNGKSILCIKFRQNNETLPIENQAPIFKTKKQVSFSWANKRRSCCDSTGPTYDYIDIENGSDPVYSKVLLKIFIL